MARFHKQLEKLKLDIEILDKRLGNPGFMKKAPTVLIEELKSSKNEKMKELDLIHEKLLSYI